MFRWVALAILLGTIAISAFHRRRARREGETRPRHREGGWLILGRVLAAGPLFGGVLLHVAVPSWMHWASLPLPEWVRWIGVGAGLLVMPAAHWVLHTLGRNVSETVLTKDEHELVTNGPYRWIRHPLYTTGIVLFSALGLVAASWFILGWTLVALAGVRGVVIPREEQELLVRFGGEYEEYIRRTGAMLPPNPHD